MTAIRPLGSLAPDLAPDLAQDLAAVAGIDVVPRILNVVCRTTGLGFAAVARVTQDRWVACAVQDEISFGLRPGGELEVASTLCAEIRDSGEAVVIDCVAEDPIFRDHHTPARYGFQSYISTPIYRGGVFFGTLCAIDPRPAQLKTPEVIATFELFAELIGKHLEAHARLALTEAELSTARETAAQREHFLAALGHDMRNPLAAIQGGTSLMRRNLAPERAKMVLDEMQRSVQRITGMIDNVLDFARARLSGGIATDTEADADVAAALEQVAAELRTGQPARAVELEFDLTAPVACDARRLAQLASNLVANALSHGAQDSPVRMAARTTDGMFELSVSNAGAPIDPVIMAGLFQPFAKGTSGKQGSLGLGLYIASEIARAHNGALTVTSDETETRFTFRMPL
jgi:signal transduction histidine kinase